MTEDEARDQLRRMVASDTFPTLDGYELQDLLISARRPDRWGTTDVGVPSLSGEPRTAAEGQFDVWEPSKAYSAGDTVVPRRRNGYVYSCTVAGTSGTADPDFPMATGATVVDGGATWQEFSATVWQPTYDLNAAAAEGWRWKAARTSNRIGFSSQGDNYNADQFHQHCLDMAKYYEGRRAYSLRTDSIRTKPLDVVHLPRAN